MSYFDEISKIELPSFAEIYLFTMGSRVYRLTSYSEDFVFQGNTYKKAAIKRNTPPEDENFKPIRMQITMPVMEPVNAYIAQTPLEPIELSITRVFVHDLTAYDLVFTGEITGVTMVMAGDQGAVLADCESNSKYMRNKIPQDLFQSFCNNTLYKADEEDRKNCNLNKEDWRVNAIITISGSTIISSTFASFADGYFKKGHVETDFGDFRSITNHVGNTLTLNVPFDSRLLDGATVAAYPGCDLAPLTCTVKFSNFAKFRGMPYIQTVNPTIYGAK